MCKDVDNEETICAKMWTMNRQLEHELQPWICRQDNRLYFVETKANRYISFREANSDKS